MYSIACESPVHRLDQWHEQMDQMTVAEPSCQSPAVAGIAPRALMANSGDYGYCRVEMGKLQLARNMRINDIEAVDGDKCPRGAYGRPSVIAPSNLKCEFTVDHPDHAWVTGNTYFRIWQGWLYLPM